MRYCDTLMQDISIQDINSAQHILEQESQPAFLELGPSEKKSEMEVYSWSSHSVCSRVSHLIGCLSFSTAEVE